MENNSKLKENRVVLALGEKTRMIQKNQMDLLSSLSQCLVFTANE
jgi:hypothetical protein